MTSNVSSIRFLDKILTLEKVHLELQFVELVDDFLLGVRPSGFEGVCFPVFILQFRA